MTIPQEPFRSPWIAGPQIRGFVVTAEIAHGGTGSVWAAVEAILGREVAHRGNYDLAVRAFLQAGATGEQFTPVDCNLGLSLRALEDTDGAVRAFQRVAQLSSDPQLAAPNSKRLPKKRRGGALRAEALEIQAAARRVAPPPRPGTVVEETYSHSGRVCSL